MNNAAAPRATRAPCGVGKVAIIGEQQFMELGVSQQVSVQGGVLLGAKMLTTMAKPGRNDPCPCGSGNKYKKCCLANEGAAASEQLAKPEGRALETAGAHRPPLRPR